MKLNLKNLNPGTFFPFDEDDREKKNEGITIRLANGEIIAEIDKKCSKKKIEFKRAVRHEYIV